MHMVVKCASCSNIYSYACKNTKKSQIHHFLVMKLLFLINFCLVILGNVSKRLSRKILRGIDRNVKKV